MRYVFLINPEAGKKPVYEQVIPEIKKYFAENGGDYKILFSNEKGDIQEKSKSEAETGDEVVLFACGGEGTGFEVLNGIAGFENVTFSVIPTGSANDFLKSFGEENKELFMDISGLVKGVDVKMDVIKADEFYCLNGCSVGMDAVVARDMSLFKRWPLVSGSLAYKFALVKTFFGKLGTRLEIKINGIHKYAKNCLLAVVGNGPAYGGGYYATPDAVPFDGILDFTVVETIDRFKILKFLKIYEKGKHSTLECCDTGVCTSMEFDSGKPIPVNLDGEIFERSHMKFEVMKKFVNFRIPLKLVEKMNLNTKNVLNT